MMKLTQGLAVAVAMALPAFACAQSCENELKLQQIGFFAEAMSAISGKPLVDVKGEEARTPYAREHYRTLGEEKVPVKVAVLTSADYSEAFEARLKALGFLGLAIRNPDEKAIETHKDFVLIPEWVRTVMPAPASVDAWLAGMSGSARNQMKRKLAKSQNVRYEIAELNWADYELWRTELFNKEILVRDGAIPAWNVPEKQAVSFGAKFDPALPLATQMIPNVKRIFFYSDSGELIGGSLIQFSPDRLLRVRAAAFEANARAQLELAVRSFAISIGLAKEAGMTHVSYGEDYSIFGIDTTTGLLQFKANLGMELIPSPMIKSYQLIKIFPEAQERLRANIPPGSYPGFFMLGIAGSDPERVQKYKELQAAAAAALSFEDRIQLSNRILRGLQVGADDAAPEVKAPAGLKQTKLAPRHSSKPTP